MSSSQPHFAHKVLLTAIALLGVDGDVANDDLVALPPGVGRVHLGAEVGIHDMTLRTLHMMTDLDLKERRGPGGGDLVCGGLGAQIPEEEVRRVGLGLAVQPPASLRVVHLNVGNGK